MPGGPVICISGFAATGKSTVARRIAKSLGLRYVSGGDALKALAVEMGYRPGGRSWWESGEGLRFLSLRKRDLSFDKMVDKKLLEIAERGNVVVDSWVLPWILGDRSLNIWMSASVDVRAERMGRRAGISINRAKRILLRRDSESRRIYRRLYGVRLGEDFSPFHLIIDTTYLTATQVYEIILSFVEMYLKSRSPK
jgi:cytidylate kinase